MLRAMLVLIATTAGASALAAPPARLRCQPLAGNGPFSAFTAAFKGKTLELTARWSVKGIAEGERTYLATQHGGQAAGGGIYLAGGGGESSKMGTIQVATPKDARPTKMAVSFAGGGHHLTGLYRCRLASSLTHANGR